MGRVSVVRAPVPVRVSGPATRAPRPNPSPVDPADDEDAMTPESALEAARTGDEQAFVVLYRELHPRITRYLTGLVGAEAEDVAADAWYQVARDLRTFTGDLDGFRGWVTTIARNRALDHLRARARRPVVLDDLVGHDRAADDDTAQTAVDRVRSAQAVAAIAALPQEMAEAVMLRVVIGLDATAAGQVLGKKPGAVRVAAHRGLRRLAQTLDRSATEDSRPE